MRHLYFSVVLCILFMACNRSNSSPESPPEVTTIEVDLDEAEPVYMSDYFSGINYHYLKTPGDRPIGRVWKMMFRDNYVALYDRARKSIWVYTLEGEFVNEIKIPIGRGPGELMHPQDVIFTENREFHILGKLKIVAYDFEGQFVGETKFHFWVYNFTYNPSTDEYIGYASNSLNQGRLKQTDHGGKNLILFDNSGDITRSFLPIGEGREQIGYGIPNNFPTYDGKQLFHAHLVDTIYSITENGVSPRYVLDYGDYAIPEEVFGRRYDYRKDMYDWTEFMDKEIKSKDYITYLGYFNETDSLLHFRVSTGDENYVVFYDKETQETHVGRDNMINDIDYGKLPYMFEAHNDTLYTVISSNMLLRHLNKLYENDREKYVSPKMIRLRELAHSMDENRNPILVVMPFKKKSGE